ncbi:DUF4135 domain-containing protein [Tumebacillus algifaecis]|nr:DUF4135 domain-containing protein [Tumebacillus algifaecis]
MNQTKMQNHPQRTDQRADARHPETSTTEKMQSAQGHLLQMQRQYGNRATAQFLKAHMAQPLSMQAPIQRDDDPAAKQEIKNGLHQELAAELTQLAQNYYYHSYRFRKQATIDLYLDQKIDTLIAKHGTKNYELIKMSILGELDTLGARQKQILAVIEQTFAAMPKETLTSKNKELIKNALNPPAMSDPFDEANLSDYAITFAQEQSRAILQNLTTIIGRVTADWAQLQAELGLGGALAWIHLTGSDFHNQGQQVCLLEAADGSKAVYKPRSVSPDRAVLGHDTGMFPALNKLSGGRLLLPSMKFIENAQAGYSYVEFQKQETVKDSKSVLNHYYKMGQITVASKLLGANDLHQDNVMSTSAGPNVIDAETSFLPYLWQAESYAETGIQGALKSFTTTGDDLTNNHFVTPTEKATWDSMSDADRKARRLHSFGDFIRERRRNDLTGECNYLAAFEWGVADAVQVIEAKQDEIVKMILTRIGGIKNIRVVPLATQEFTQMIASFQDDLRNGMAADMKMIDHMKSQIVKSLQAKGFQMEGGSDATLGKGLLQDFQIRDTPIFHFEPTTNELTYHHTKVGSHIEWAAPDVLLRKAVGRVAATDVKKLIRELQIGS